MLRSLRHLRTFSTQTVLSETVRDFLDPKVFYQQLQYRSFDFFTGIPDSLLSDFLNYIADVHPAQKNIIAANQGAAIGIASGWHLATRRYPVVFMQNAGIGNAVNPLISLVDQRVYKIPMLLLIGWRGEPGKKDEPQHKVQGVVMNSLLEHLGIQFQVLPDYQQGAAEALDKARAHIDKTGAPFAFMVRRRTFFKYDSIKKIQEKYPLSREEALQIFLDHVKRYDAVISTSGFTSRQLYSLRVQKQHTTNQDFYSLGARGHNSSIAMGVALSKPSKTVYCLDGDASFMFHMGAQAVLGARKVSNFKHIVFNNQVHGTAGGMPSVGDEIDFARLAKACGYQYAASASTAEEIKQKLKELASSKGPGFLEIKVTSFTRHDLRGLVMQPKENKELFMNFLDK